MHAVRRILIFLLFVLLGSLAPPEFLAAQNSQDNQPHITPRRSPPEPTPKPKATPSPQEPQEQPPSTTSPAEQAPGESSSRDSQADFGAAPRAAEPAPAEHVDEGTFLPYD